MSLIRRAFTKRSVEWSGLVPALQHFGWQSIMLGGSSQNIQVAMIRNRPTCGLLATEAALLNE